MRNRFASICLLATALLVTPDAFAQGRGKKPPAAATKKDDKKAAGDDKKAGGKGAAATGKGATATGKGAASGPAREVSLDEEKPDEGPVNAGQMTEEAAQGKRLFDAERWSEAALILKRV